VTTYSENALAGSGGALGRLPVTINAGGALTSEGTVDSSHIRGVLTLNGGTLADGGTANQPAFGTWDLDDGVVVGGTQTSVISANQVIPDQAGGTLFNVAVTGGNPDLDVQGSLIAGTTTADTGIIKLGSGTLQLDAVNTYSGPTTIGAGTLTINSGALLGGASGIYGGLLTITNNGTLNYDNSATQTFNGVLRGASGFINVNSGTLVLNAASVSTNAISVASSANLSVVAGGIVGAVTNQSNSGLVVNYNTAGSQWISTNLIFQGSSSTLTLNFSNSLSAAASPVKVNGNINFATGLTLTLNGSQLIPTGTYPLITWTGTASGIVPTTANGQATVNLSGITATVVTSGSALNLVVSVGTGPVTWDLGSSSSGIWDAVTPNWLGGVLFKNGDAVTFGDTLTGPGPITVTLNAAVAPSSVTFSNSAKNYILSGTGGITAAGPLTLAGPGTTTISTVNQISGSTTVTNGGTLTLDFTHGAASGIISGSTLTLGGATLNVLGSATLANDDSFGSLTLSPVPGTAVINVTAGAGGNPELDLGTLTYNAGSPVVFNGPATSTGASSAAGQTGANGNAVTNGVVGATADITTTTGPTDLTFVSGGSGANQYGIYATVGLYDFAAPSGSSPYTIVGLSQVSGGTAGDGGYNLASSAGTHSTALVNDVIASYTPSGTHATGVALRFNSPASLTITSGSSQACALGGVLVTPNVGANNTTLTGNSAHGFSPGYIRSGGGSSVIFFQNNLNGYLNFTGLESWGANNGGSWVQAGPGTMVWNTVNNNLTTGQANGPFFLDGGVSEIFSDGSLGDVGTAAPVSINGGTLLAAATLALDNSGASPRPVNVFGNGGALAAVTGGTFTVAGLVSGAAPLIIGIPASTNNQNTLGQVPGSGTGTANPTALFGNGTVVVKNTANTYSGGTVLDSGILQLSGSNLGIYGTGGITLNGGTFQWPAGNTTDISSRTVTLGSVGGTLDVNNNALLLANGIGNGGSGQLTVASTAAGGSLTLGGANTYTGGTVVTSGSTLLVNGSLSTGTVTVNGTLGGAGAIGGNVTLNSGALATVTNGTPLTVSGSLTLNNNTVTVNVNGSQLTSVGSPFTLLHAGGISGTPNAIPGGNAIAGGYAGTVSVSGNSLILTVVATGVSSTWNANANGNWSAAGNWSSGVPHLAGDGSTFGNGNPSAFTVVNLDVNETNGAITFSNPGSFAISNAVDTLTLDNRGNGVAITVTSGTSNAIQTAVSLNDTVSSVAVSSGNVLAITGPVANGVNGTKTLTANGAGTLALSGNNSYGPAAGSVGTTLSGGTLQAGNNNALGAGDFSLSASSTLQAGAPVSLANNVVIGPGVVATLDDSSANNLTLGGVLSGSSGSVKKTSGGTITLGNPANTYGGGTTINGGFLSISQDSDLGAVPASVAANNLTLNGGGLRGAGTPALNANRGITLTGTGLLDAASGADLTVNGLIFGPGQGITVNSGAGDTGTVTLNAANTFNGTAAIAAGTLQLGNASALQNATVGLNGGTLDFNTFPAATIGGFSGTGSVTLQTAAGTGAAVALSLGNNATTATYAGNLGGSGSLTVVGGGNLTIGSGASGGASYTGATTVQNGTLTLGGVGNMSSTGNLTLVGQYGNTGTAYIANNAVVATTGSILLDTASSSSFGTVSVFLTVANNASLSAAAFNFGNGPGSPIGSSVTVTNHGSLTVSGAFNLFGSAYGAGGTTLNLAGGITTVGNFVATSGTSTRTSFIDFNGGELEAATNDPAGSEFLPALTGLTVNVTNAVDAAVINSAGYTITVAANITGGSAGLVKLGSGILILSGANTYAGLTTVSNGTLLVSGSLNNASENVAVNDGSAFGAFYNTTTPVIGTLTLGQSSGSSLVFSNLSSTTAAALHADFVYLNGHATVNIDDAANLSAGNEYPLAQIGGLIVTNSGNGFSLTLPGGVTGFLTNDTTIIPGYTTLGLVVTSIVPFTPPVILASPVISGNNLVLSASGGNPGDPVTLLSTTNLTLPPAQWTTVTTGNYDGNGNFNYTVTGALSSGLPQQFYLLQGQ